MSFEDYDWLLDEALEEDCARRDVTTRPLVGPDRTARAALVLRQPGVIAGLPLAQRLAERYDERIRFNACVADGDRLGAGERAAELEGPAAALLSIERTMLNFLQRLSGVATLTAQYVDAVKDTSARIYDTRKTTPGWRRLEKYAVRCGGGSNHRMSLADQVLIKDNHLALMDASDLDAPAPPRAVALTRRANAGLTIEVEVDTLAQLREVLPARPDIILLDNMTAEQVREAVETVKAECDDGARPLLEASGMVNLENVGLYAEAGADRIAIGALTHSAPALDISMELSA